MKFINKLYIFYKTFTGYAIDPPCCVPTEFDDLSMLTVTKKQFITKNPTNSDLLLKQHLMNQNQSDAEEEVTLLRIYQSMIATKCGCKWAVHPITFSVKTKSEYFTNFYQIVYLLRWIKLSGCKWKMKLDVQNTYYVLTFFYLIEIFTFMFSRKSNSMNTYIRVW